MAEHTVNHIRLNPRVRDLTGMTFGRLTAVEPTELRAGTGMVWRCVCACGTERFVPCGRLTSGNTASCGCLQRDKAAKTAAKLFTRHGSARVGAITATFRGWQEMRKRCLDPRATNFERYGGRGITVCERWLTFDNFREDMGERPTKELSLDRINNNGNYEPGNCRWATAKEQANNRRKARNTTRNVFLTWRGETFCVAEWAERIGIEVHALRHRIDRGWSVERALTTPSAQHTRRTR